MNEHQWLTSTNPSDMYDFFIKIATEKQRRFLLDVRIFSNLDACNVLRDIIGNPFRSMVFGDQTYFKCNHLFVPNPTGEDRCRFVVSDDGNWGQFHCNMPLISHGVVLLDRAWLTWNNNTIPNLVDVMLFYNLGVPRAEPQWDMMAAIHDALLDAGCTEATILNHLRGEEPCPHCNGKGKWGDAYGTMHCTPCYGTGKRQVRHIRGCWLVELLTGEI